MNLLVTLFDKLYPADKQAEGQAVSWAVASGACNKCPLLWRCEIDERFTPPAKAACMKKKAEILAGMKGGGA